MDVTDIKDWLEASKTAVDLLKTAYAVLPKGQNRDEIENKVRMAEDILKRSDAKLAKDLGYHLCQCTFPPPIMLWEKDFDWWKCPGCGNTITSRQVELGRIRGTSGGPSRGAR